VNSFLDSRVSPRTIDSNPELGIKILKGVSRVLSLRLRQLAERLVVIF
jgi:hypothetical protein